MSWGQIILTTLLGGGGAVLMSALLLPSQLRKARAETGKTDIDAAAVIKDSALSLLEPFNARIKDLESRLDDAEKRAHTAERTADRAQQKADQLERQLRAAVVESGELRDTLHRYRELHGPLPA